LKLLCCMNSELCRGSGRKDSAEQREGAAIVAKTKALPAYNLPDKRKRRTVPQPWYYAEMCSKYPRFLHMLDDYPEPPEPLSPCPFCGGAAEPCITYGSGYGLPGYRIRCTGCSAATFPAMWGCTAYRGGEWQPVTEKQALLDACRSWNRRPEDQRGGGDQ